MKKKLIFILFFLLLVSTVLSYKTVFNPYTGRFDYVNYISNSTDEAATKVWILQQNYLTNISMNKSVRCEDVYGSPDTDFCTDANTGGGGGGNSTEEMIFAINNTGIYNINTTERKGNSSDEIESVYYPTLVTYLNKTEGYTILGDYINYTTIATYTNLTTTYSLLSTYANHSLMTTYMNKTDIYSLVGTYSNVSLIYSLLSTYWNISSGYLVLASYINYTLISTYTNKSDIYSLLNTYSNTSLVYSLLGTYWNTTTAYTILETYLNLTTFQSSNTTLTTAINNRLINDTSIQLPNGTSSVLSLGFRDMGQTGFYVFNSGAIAFRWKGNNQMYLQDTIWQGVDGDGMGLRLAGVSSTVPTLYPKRTDADTGIGSAANGLLSIISNGSEKIRVTPHNVTILTNLSVLGNINTNNSLVADYKTLSTYLNKTGDTTTGRITFGSFLNLDSQTLTIATGNVTTTTSYIFVDTEASAATDELYYINGGNTGDVLIVRSFSSTRDTTMVDTTTTATGNLRLISNFTLDSSTDILTLIKISSELWVEVSRSDNG